MQSQRFGSNAKVIRWCAPLLVLVAGLAMTGSAAAQSGADVPDPDLTTPRPPSTGPVNLLPEAVSARVTEERATVTTWAGYDGAKRSPLIIALADARIVSRLAFFAGAGYTADMPGAPAFRPQLGLRAQLLGQAKHGIDAGASVLYRQDLFTNEGGFFEGIVALERRQGRVRVMSNLLYGQDGEGDDRDGEVRLAAMYDAGHGLLVGFDSRYRHSLWSSDPNRFTRDRPEYEMMAAPTASFSYGSWAVMAEAGVSSVRTTVTSNGVIALGGLASTF